MNHQSSESSLEGEVNPTSGDPSCQDNCQDFSNSDSPQAEEANMLNFAHFYPSGLNNILSSAPRPLVICGPSGSGKSTLLKKLMSEFSDYFGFSVSRKSMIPQLESCSNCLINYRYYETTERRRGRRQRISLYWQGIYADCDRNRRFHWVYQLFRKLLRDFQEVGERCPEPRKDMYPRRRDRRSQEPQEDWPESSICLYQTSFSPSPRRKAEISSNWLWRSHP